MNIRYIIRLRELSFYFTWIVNHGEFIRYHRYFPYTYLQKHWLALSAPTDAVVISTGHGRQDGCHLSGCTMYILTEALAGVVSTKWCSRHIHRAGQTRWLPFVRLYNVYTYRSIGWRCQHQVTPSSYPQGTRDKMAAICPSVLYTVYTYRSTDWHCQYQEMLSSYQQGTTDKMAAICLAVQYIYLQKHRLALSAPSDAVVISTGHGRQDGCHLSGW